MAKMYDEKKPAIRIIAHYKDFDGNLERWKDSFYHLWRLQLTWDFAYLLNLNESRQNGVYVDLLVKPAYKKNVIDSMEDLGYKDIKAYDEKIAIIYGPEHEELEDIEEVFIEY